MEPDFDRAAAKAAGYTDAEIDAFLSSRQQQPSIPRVAEGAPRESTMAPRGLSRTERVQADQRREEGQERFRQQMGAIPAAIANVSRDIPGAEALQAGVRSVARGQPYREALGDIRGATEALPAAVSIPTRLAGGIAASTAMPGSTLARQAMAYGAASGLTEANPDIGPLERALRAGGQALLGGAVTKTAQAAGTAVRAARTPSRSSIVMAERQARDEAAAPLYEQFKQLGELPRTEQLDELLQLPVVRRAIRTVKGESAELADLADTDARVLDAVYKRIGNKAFKSATGYETGDTRIALANALDEASGGLYGPALAAFREGSQRVGAVVRGGRAFQTAVSPQGAMSEKALTENTPEALMRWMQTATPEQRRLAIQGMLGAASEGAGASVTTAIGGLSPLPGIRRTFAASRILEQMEGGNLSPLRRALRLSPAAQLTPRDNAVPR